MSPPDLVLLGNLLIDDVVLPDGRTRMAEPGGATLYASLGASLWGLRTGLVSWRGQDYPAWALEAMTARGVDLSGVRSLDGAGLRTWLLYEGRRRRVVHRLDGPTHAQVSPTFAQIPAEWRQAPAFHLAPMPFDIQAELVTGLAALRGALVSLDPHLHLAADTLPSWAGVLAGVDVLFVSEDEMRLNVAAPQAVVALQAAGARRLSMALFKRGSRGGLLYEAGTGGSCTWPAMAVRVVDPTGAGDAFAAGFLAGILKGDSPASALRRGVVSASFALEEWGCNGLLHATPGQAGLRLREWFGA